MLIIWAILRKTFQSRSPFFAEYVPVTLLKMYPEYSDVNVLLVILSANPTKWSNTQTIRRQFADELFEGV